MEPDRISCPERAIRVFDFMALAVVAMAVFAILRGGDGTAAAAAEFESSWSDLLLAIVTASFLVAMLWIVQRRRSGEDEYLRRLIGFAASTGVFFTIVVWVGWELLANSWVTAPSGEQVIGVLLACTALAYGWSRLRSV